MNWGEAGILSGIVARLGGYPAGRTQDDLNDALIFLQARQMAWLLSRPMSRTSIGCNSCCRMYEIPFTGRILMTSTDRVRRVNERGGSQTRITLGSPSPPTFIDRRGREETDRSFKVRDLFHQHDLIQRIRTASPAAYPLMPQLGDTAAFARDLDAVLEAGDIAAVLLRLEDGDERTLIDRAKAIEQLSSAAISRCCLTAIRRSQSAPAPTARISPASRL